MFAVAARLLLLAAVFVPTAALADAVIYQGTLGRYPVVVELSAPVESAAVPFAGRYFYPREGVDIPLQPLGIAAGKVRLGEEKPCLEDACSDYSEAAPPPELGATWTLTAAPGGETLSGSWQPETGKALPVSLRRVATRPLPADFEVTPLGLGAFAVTAWRSGDLATSPYDRLKMEAPLEESDEAVRDGAGFVYATDKRTQIRFPRLTRLPGADPAVANAWLEARHRQLGLAALECKSRQFRGMNPDGHIPYGGGTLGGFEDETIEVTYLSPRLLGWQESGSLYCGGAHPYNHSNSYTLDLVTGELLDPGRIFTGWGTDAAIADFVRARRDKSDAQLDAECGIDELIDEHLQVGFRDGNRVFFSLEGLPHVIAACEGPLLEMPLAEVRELLTPEAQAYFPALGG
jgi:hypothetical protein